jgi:hypothetical protein
LVSRKGAKKNTKGAIGDGVLRQAKNDNFSQRRKEKQKALVEL